ncbi:MULTISPECIES: ABC transporter permease [Haloferax]|uniref:ABC transporter permease subunit n=2 Tax=Haloferax TaxID=2251 RepID=A0ACD5I4M0_9EURY|nr:MULTISPECIES: ABC transporter permease subunit [Haloferax]QIB77594.1 ABC transporter permease subunit [Haloferax alexandrinus]RDZ30728.1 nitrite reductase [Haloferax sp. Atlit-48N]RDZ33766.1 nitrite reductase [Haloferax sp. Atlit-24N]RDZ35911.1 nitrite reductase [Haloferax sp. Atlit-47N]RLM34288.1 nitrite reductase [Haloferax sp. Atlit-109R]
MRWSPLARSEYRTVLTSKGAWILALLVVLWGFRPTYAGWDAVGRNITIGYVQIGVDLFLPIGALLLSYQSLIDERTTGSIKFLLGLPLTRTQILLGKTGGRFVGVGTAAVAATLVLAAIGLIEHGTFALLPFLGTLVATLLFAGVMVAIGVFVSTVARRTVTAATGVFAYFLATVFWSRIVTSLYTAVTGVPVDPYDAPASGPLFLALRLTPDGAYNVLTNWFLGVGNSTELFHIVYTKLEPGVSVNAFVVEAAFDGGGPWYLHPALSLVVLLVWAVVPVALARRAFTRGDAL